MFRLCGADNRYHPHHPNTITVTTGTTGPGPTIGTRRWENPSGCNGYTGYEARPCPVIRYVRVMTVVPIVTVMRYVPARTEF